MSAHFARPDRHPALDGLRDRRMLRELAYVDGHWTAGDAGQTFEVSDPASGAKIGWVSKLNADQTTIAIDAAAKAFPLWRDLLPQERTAKLRRWYELDSRSQG